MRDVKVFELGDKLEEGEVGVVRIEVHPDVVAIYTSYINEAIEKALRLVLPHGHVAQIKGILVEVENGGNPLKGFSPSHEFRHPNRND